MMGQGRILSAALLIRSRVPVSVRRLHLRDQSDELSDGGVLVDFERIKRSITQQHCRMHHHWPQAQRLNSPLPPASPSLKS